MRRNAAVRLATVAVATIVAAGGCSKSKSNSSVPATMHVLRGASSTTTPFAPPGGAAAAADGLWFLSPDQAKVTLSGLKFLDSHYQGPSVALTNCTPTYQRAIADGAQLLDCPFAAPVGTWAGLEIDVDPSTEVLVNDSADGLFTTANGLVTSAPASVDFAPVTIPAGGGGTNFPNIVFFPQPLVVASSNLSLTLLVDMNHTLFANVSGGTATFNTSLPVSPASVVAAEAGGGRAVFYSATGTADNYDGGSVTGDDSGSVRLYYPTPGGQPGFLFLVRPGPGEAYPLNASTAFVGGYLGRDASGKLCWANAAQDKSWAHYSQYCVMQETTSLGASTSLACKTADPAPTPVSGDTYASGCPSIGTPDFSETLYLVAQ